MSGWAQKAVRAGGNLLAVGLLVFLGVRLWQLWSRQPIDLDKSDAGLFVAAVVASAAAVVTYGLVWPAILRRLGVPASASWLGLYFKAQLAKYVPGSVWQYAGRVGLARRRGVSAETGIASVLVEIVASSVAAGVIALLALPLRWTMVGWGAVIGFAAVAHLLRSRVTRGLLRFRAVRVRALAGPLPAATGAFLLAFFCYGFAFWLTARALFAVPSSQIPYYLGVFAAGWLAGFVAVFAPGGIGVREAVIAALLAGRLGEAHAITLAAASRLILSAIDLLGGSAALAAPLIRPPRGGGPVGAGEHLSG